MSEEWITASEASELLDISERQVLNRIYNGKLKAKKDGKKWLIHKSLSEPSELPNEVLESSRNAPRKEELISYLRDQVEHLKAQAEQKDQQLTEKDKQIEKLQVQLERANEALAEASHRHDTVVMQMTKLLEYHQQPFWRRFFSRKALPSPADESIVNTEIHTNKEMNGKST